MSAQQEPVRFGFVIHPVYTRQLLGHPMLRLVGRVLADGALERVAALLPSIVAGEVRGVRSPLGPTAHGYLYGLPVTGRLMLARPPQWTYRKLAAIARWAERMGCRILGLGAYTSVVGDAGLTLSRQSPIPVTSGNSYTVAAAAETLRLVSRKAGLEPGSERLAVIGATGSIGSVLSRLMAREVEEIVLCAPREEKLRGLAARIGEESPGRRVTFTTSIEEALRGARLVITATSAVDPVVRVEWLSRGAVVLDIAQPPDISPEGAEARRDVVVVQSGEILLPSGELTFDIGLPPGQVFACLAETIVLALEGRFESYTVGRDIALERVEEIWQMATRHGFRLAPERSFGEEVSPQRFAHLREINAGVRSASS